jgi:hypothetical protein
MIVPYVKEDWVCKDLAGIDKLEGEKRRRQNNK